MPLRPGKPITVAKATERYATWIRGNYAKGSLPSMLSVLRRFGDLFDGGLVTEITSGRLAEWKADRMRDGAAGATIAREVSVIRGFFEWLLDEGLIDRNPAGKLKRPERTPRRKRQWLDKDELAEVLNAAHGLKERLPLALMGTIGLRRAEVGAVRWGDLDGADLMVPGKGGTYRPGAVPPSTRHLLAKWRRELEAAIGRDMKALDHIVPAAVRIPDPRKPTETKGYYYEPAKGISARGVSLLLGRISGRIGRTITPHDLRRTYNGLLRKVAKLDLGDRQKLMRHSSPSTTVSHYDEPQDTVSELLPKDDPFDF
jgi:integrase